MQNCFLTCYNIFLCFMTFLWILISPIFYWLSEFSPRSHFEYAMTPSCSQQSGGSRRRFKTWRRTETWRINIGDRQFLNFFIWMGGDYLTLSFAEKSRVLYWSIKRITAQTFLMYNGNLSTFFDPDFPLQQLASETSHVNLHQAIILLQVSSVELYTSLNSLSFQM